MCTTLSVVVVVVVVVVVSLLSKDTVRQTIGRVIGRSQKIEHDDRQQSVRTILWTALVWAMTRHAWLRRRTAAVVAG